MSPVTINAAPQPRGKTPLYAHLYFQVIVAITIGILLGHFYPDIGTSMKPLGDAFIKLVKMIIAPVIFLTVSTGIAGMSDLKKVGRVAGKAMLYFLTFSTLALIVGLIVANVVQPGAGMNIDAAIARSEGRRYVHTTGTRTEHRRLPDQYHPDDNRRCFRIGRYPAGTVLLGAVRSFSRHGRRES